MRIWIFGHCYCNLKMTKGLPLLKQLGYLSLFKTRHPFAFFSASPFPSSLRFLLFHCSRIFYLFFQGVKWLRKCNEPFRCFLFFFFVINSRAIIITDWVYKMQSSSSSSSSSINTQSYFLFLFEFFVCFATYLLTYLLAHIYIGNDVHSA